MRWLLLTASVALCVSVLPRSEAVAARTPKWDAAAAARYLDTRLNWWRQWPKSQRDHDTRCVSCHTSLPHVLAMPSLRQQAGSSRRTPDELAMFDDVTKRVYLWDEVEPFYPDQTRGVPKTAESRGVESVLNALILTTRDRERGFFGPDTRQAMENMWAQQMKTGQQKGGFAWLHFRLEPFESTSAPYWGATLAALAVARMPEGYAADTDVAPHVEELQAYLRTGLTGSLYTRTLVLWADSQLGGILQPAERDAIVAQLIEAQNDDGGWSLPALSDWKRIDGSELPSASDGYATATVALVLRETGLASGAKALKAGQNWLTSHQDKVTGAVPAVSINKDRKPGTDAFLFMSDEATGMAALAMRPA